MNPVLSLNPINYYFSQFIAAVASPVRVRPLHSPRFIVFTQAPSDCYFFPRFASDHLNYIPSLIVTNRDTIQKRIFANDKVSSAMQESYSL